MHRIRLVFRLIALPIFLWGALQLYHRTISFGNEVQRLEQAPVASGKAVAEVVRQFRTVVLIALALASVAPATFRMFQQGMRDVHGDVLSARRTQQKTRSD